MKTAFLSMLTLIGAAGINSAEAGSIDYTPTYMPNSGYQQQMEYQQQQMMRQQQEQQQQMQEQQRQMQQMREQQQEQIDQYHRQNMMNHNCGMPGNCF